MEITRRSRLSGRVTTREINVTQEQLDRWEAKDGLIQEIMPRVSAEDREFIMTGITPDEWDMTFGGDGS